MTTVQLSDEATEVLDRIAKLRGVDRATALAEALGVEARIAEAIDKGDTILLGKKGKFEQLVLGKRS